MDEQTVQSIDFLRSLFEPPNLLKEEMNEWKRHKYYNFREYVCVFMYLCQCMGMSIPHHYDMMISTTFLKILRESCKIEELMIKKDEKVLIYDIFSSSDK